MKKFNWGIFSGLFIILTSLVILIFGVVKFYSMPFLIKLITLGFILYWPYFLISIIGMITGMIILNISVNGKK